MRAHGLAGRSGSCSVAARTSSTASAPREHARGARSELPTALVAFNDDIAAAAMSVLAQQGIDVPGEMSIVGFDDSALARSPGIDLTSVQQLPREMARLAVERIVARTEGADVAAREIVLEPELRVRTTTGPAAGPAMTGPQDPIRGRGTGTPLGCGGRRR